MMSVASSRSIDRAPRHRVWKLFGRVELTMTGLTEANFVAAYVNDQTPLDRYFLVGAPGRQVVGCWHDVNGLMACVIEDDDENEAAQEFLRRRGNPTFASVTEAYAHAARMRWPGWERHAPAFAGVARYACPRLRDALAQLNGPLAAYGYAVVEVGGASDMDSFAVAVSPSMNVDLKVWCDRFVPFVLLRAKADSDGDRWFDLYELRKLLSDPNATDADEVPLTENGVRFLTSSLPRLSELFARPEASARADQVQAFIKKRRLGAAARPLSIQPPETERRD